MDVAEPLFFFLFRISPPSLPLSKGSAVVAVEKYRRGGFLPALNKVGGKPKAPISRRLNSTNFMEGSDLT